MGFVGIAIFPIDIGLSNHGESASNGFIVLWYVIYFTTCILSWFYLPVMMNYWVSGEFNSRCFDYWCYLYRSRLLEAVLNYVRSYAVLGIGIVVIVLYIILSKTAYGIEIVVNDRSLSSMMSIMMASVNTYGMCFIVVYLGYGLVALPLRYSHFSDLIVVC